MSESTELARMSVPADGVTALSLLDEPTFEAKIVAMKRGQERIRRIQRELMIGPTGEDPEGEDYGIIPGTKKPTLLQPGAEKLCKFYGLVPKFTEQIIQGDGKTVPHLRVIVHCFIHHGDETGPLAAEGYGAANSWEKKHRYRNGSNVCPACGSSTVMRSKDRVTGELNGDWFCWVKKGGCGAEFRKGSEEVQQIESQVIGTIENPDPYEAENTLLKIAKKRALVDATKLATATSGLFTQDAEDLETRHGTGEAKQEAKPKPENGKREPTPKLTWADAHKQLCERIKAREVELIAANKCESLELLTVIEESWAHANLPDNPAKLNQASWDVMKGIAKAVIEEFEKRPERTAENLDADPVDAELENALS